MLFNHKIKEIVRINERSNSAQLLTGRLRELREYSFDTVFGPDTSQLKVYDSVARPIVNDVLRGKNGAILAYGQTGTGEARVLSTICHP